MSQHILVAYGTRAESTHEVAEFTAEVLRYYGMMVDVYPVGDVRDLTPYDAVILGSAIRVGQVLPEVMKFANKHKSQLASLPVAYFAVCATMKTDLPENRAIVNSYLEPLRDIKEPVAQGMFAGRLEYDMLEFPWHFILRFAHDDELLAKGDFRQWSVIRAWGREVAQQLMELAKV